MSVSFDAATEDFEPVSEYLSGADKHEWADEHVGFDIHTIKLDAARGKFEESWLLGVTTVPVDEEPEHRKMRLGANPRRNQLMAHLQQTLRDGHAVGPVMLSNLEIDGGLTTWLIVPWTPKRQTFPAA
jgi:hypothetical protein